MESGPKKKAEIPKELEHEVSRLRLLAQFSGMKGKARELELEWQKIQQDEHDAFFAHQILHGKDNGNYDYKKGFVEGIKWCIDRFS